MHDGSIWTHPFKINRLHCLEQLLCIFQILTNLLNRIKMIKTKYKMRVCIANTAAWNIESLLQQRNTAVYL